MAVMSYMEGNGKCCIELLYAQQYAGELVVQGNDITAQHVRMFVLDGSFQLSDISQKWLIIL